MNSLLSVTSLIKLDVDVYKHKHYYNSEEVNPHYIFISEDLASGLGEELLSHLKAMGFNTSYISVDRGTYMGIPIVIVKDRSDFIFVG